MVNLETWMVAGFNKGPWLDTGKLLDAGPLGPQGRMGWFVPTSVVDSMWKKNKIVVDHWKAFEKQNIARKFSWWGKEKLQETKPDYQSHAYLNKICHKNPNQKQRNCATLFASYLGVDAGVLRSQIEALNLRVDIVWLENKHHTFIKELDPTLPVLFFTWHPSSLLASGNYTRVHLPETHSPHKDSPSDCDFPVNQLTKVLWEPIKSGAPEAYHIISKLSFSDLEYDALIAQHPTYSEDEIACDWVNANKEKWDRWLPETLKEKTKIYIGGLFPLSGKSWAQPGLKEGASLAVELVNKDKSTLSDYNLTLIIEDTKCDYDLAMSEFISLTQRSPPIAAILGTGCSDPAERIAALSKHFNILMVSFGAEAHVLSDQDKYPYFFRTVPPVHHYIEVYVELFKRMGWKMIGAIAEDGQKLPEYHLILQKKLQYEDISLTVRRKFSNSSNTPDIAQILKEFKVQNVRVIIADVFSYVAREILCEAYKQKMTAYDGYVWFLPSWYTKDWYDVDFYNHPSSSREADTLKENVPCTTAEMEHATAGYFVLHKTNLAPPQTMVVGNITLDEYNQLYEKRFGTLYDKSKYASYVYDAVWVLAKGLDALLKSNHGALETIHTPKTASAFRAQISNVSFSGVSGWIKFTGSDRHSDLLIQQVFVNETVDMGLYLAGDGTKRPRLDTDNFKNRWYSPATETKDSLGNTYEECLIENFRAQLGVTCTIANVIVTVFVFFGFVIIAIIVPIIMKYRCDAKMKKFKATHERIKELGLLKDEFSPILTVDDWEIPRKDVVLNRVLGEGAFGTVMGGEMYKEREGWVAVAVKTLKLDHKLEEKLDFFREVEMMKSFKHENIVQLWGVCTRKEPMYAVMEFCLHGDLKTYLLSRRNLVGQGVKEAEDVKAENLTQMAVDVANGLNFLHSLKYVHRDIACRNCLVHANKTVKISDFGMTRHISSTDYYRFSRKAMLPVRWTAPEALKDGIYSSKSDIWSFGVLVFEIVTFGSFPYQGLSNKEVLDYVGRGSLLMLPDKCPDNLKSFIRWCMSPDPGYRPGLEDILSYLNFSPAFLAPCLDAPTTSIVHEDTDSLEMQANPHKTLSTSHSLSSSVPASSALSNHRHWPEKLKDKKKTSSVPGLNLVGKSAKSLQTRSPVSSARSLSMYSGIMNSSSVCGLNSCSVAGLTWGNEEKEDEAAGETSVQGGAPKHKQREATLENNRVSVSIEYSCDKGESSSGYVSQTSSSEYKHICETVTSL